MFIIFTIYAFAFWYYAKNTDKKIFKICVFVLVLGLFLHVSHQIRFINFSSPLEQLDLYKR